MFRERAMESEMFSVLASDWVWELALVWAKALAWALALALVSASGKVSRLQWPWRSRSALGEGLRAQARGVFVLPPGAEVGWGRAAVSERGGGGGPARARAGPPGERG